MKIYNRNRELIHSDSDLSDANLIGANLRGVSLRGSDLSGANLKDANLRDVKINWDSHQLISEILLRSSRNTEDEMLAYYIRGKLEWCWQDWLSEKFQHVSKTWAITTLIQWAKDNNNKLPKELENYE